MITAVISKSIQLSDSFSATSGNNTTADGLLQQISNAVPVSTLETYAFALAFAKLKALYAISNIAGNLTFIKAGPANEVNVALAANQPYVWNNDGYFANPFGNNLISVAFNNVDANNVAGFKLFAVLDPT